MKVLIAIAVLAVSTFGQASKADPLADLAKLNNPVRPCQIEADQLPAVRGLKLGMPEKDAEKIIGDKFFQSAREKVYLRAAIVNPKNVPPFEQVKLVYLEAFDSKLSQIDIRYDVRWSDAKEFAANFGPKLGLPDAGWVYILGPTTAKMICSGFEVTLDYAGELRITDTTIDARIALLKEQFENDKKKAIKP